MGREKKKEGLCKLTGKHGVFVKSHILPNALTGRDGKAEPFFEVGLDGKRVKRYSSWYDYKLVIAEGEKYLEKIDDVAIRELRKNKLVWSGWGRSNRLVDDNLYWNEDKSKGMRVIHDFDSRFLRLFVKSVVWRCLSSERNEFSHLPTDVIDLESLRNSVLNLDPGDALTYPMLVTQIVTKGMTHNHTPVFETMTFPAQGEQPSFSIDYYRVYIQGLIVKMIVSLQPSEEKCLGSLLLGHSENMIASVIPFETSRQREDIRTVMRSAR